MIEKNIPMPTGKNVSTGRTPKYPEFREMEVGDSHFYKHQNGDGLAATAAKVYGYRNGKRFSSRSVEGGVRVWRIA